MQRPVEVGASITVYFDVRSASDFNSPALTEAGGQPQISKNGAAFDSYGISTLTAIGYGRYSATLDTSLISVAIGDVILTRYKGVNTSETDGDTFVVVSDDNTLPSDDPCVAFYGSVTHANLFFSNRLNATKWTNATNLNKRKALVMATQAIDRLNYCGAKTDATQVLQFPREDDSSVPNDIKFATYLIAIMFLTGYDPEIEAARLMKTSSSYSGVKSTYDRDFIPEYKMAGIPSAEAWGLLRPYLRDTRELELSRV